MTCRNVWIINQYASTLENGIGGRSFYLAKVLSDSDYRVTLIHASNHHLYRRPLTRRSDYKYKFEKVKLFTFKYSSSKSLIRIINWFVFMIGLLLYSSIKFSARPQVIVYSSPSLIPFLSAWLISRIFGAKLILDVRDLWPASLVEVAGLHKCNPLVVVNRMVEKISYFCSDVLVSCLPGFTDFLPGDYKAKSFYIPTCYYSESNDSTISTKLSIFKEKGSFNIMYAGGMGPAHNIQDLLEAAKLLIHESDIKFTLIGNGANLTRYRKFVKHNGLVNVEFLGWVSRNELHAYYRNADILFMGWNNNKIYDYGIGPNKLAEYLYHYIPIINSYSGKYDPVSLYKCGWSVPVGNPEVLAKVVLHAKGMSKPEKSGVIKNIINLYIEQFSPESFCKNWIRAISHPNQSEGI